MNWFRKRSASSKKDPLRDEIEQTIRVYLEAVRYLSTCGPFNETKFDQVDSILSRAPKGALDPAKKAQIKESVRYILPEGGLGPWDQVGVMMYRSLMEAVTMFMDLLWKLRPDDRTKEFTRWARDDLVEIKGLMEAK